MSLKSVKQLSIRRTEWEWQIIEEKIYSSGKESLTSFIRAEAVRLKKDFTNYPLDKIPEECTKIEKRPYLPVGLYQSLEEIASKMNIPVSTLIDRMILDPLLSRTTL
jgi:hypothetical protein